MAITHAKTLYVTDQEGDGFHIPVCMVGQILDYLNGGDFSKPMEINDEPFWNNHFGCSVQANQVTLKDNYQKLCLGAVGDVVRLFAEKNPKRSVDTPNNRRYSQSKGLTTPTNIGGSNGDN